VAVCNVVAPASQPEPASRLKSATHDVSFLRSDSRCRQYLSVLSNVTVRYLGPEQTGRVSLLWLIFSSRLASLLLRWKTATIAFVVLSFNFQIWRYSPAVVMPLLSTPSTACQSPSACMIARSLAYAYFLGGQRCECWREGEPGRIPEGRTPFLRRCYLLRLPLALVRVKLRLPTSSMINQTMRPSGSSCSNLQVQATLSDWCYKNVCLACNRLLFLHSSRKWEFLQLSIVIFVGEELTVIGFVREECEKTLRTGLEYLLAFGYIQTNVTTKSAIFCCVCTRKRLWQVFFGWNCTTKILLAESREV